MYALNEHFTLKNKLLLVAKKNMKICFDNAYKMLSKPRKILEQEIEKLLNTSLTNWIETI